MKTNIFVFFICLTISIGCKHAKKDHIYPPTPKDTLLEATQVLVYGDIFAKINADNSIYGYGNNQRRFYTKDNFKTMNYSGIYTTNILYDDGLNVIRYDGEINHSDSLTFNSSSDGGFSFFPSLKLNSYLGFSNFHFLNPSTGYYFTSTNIPYQYDSTTIHLHKIINFKDSLFSSVKVKYFGAPFLINFSDENRGTMAVFPVANVYASVNIYNTYNGGKSWLGPYTLNMSQDSNNSYYYITALKIMGQTTIAYVDNREQKNYFYISADQGKTWSFRNLIYKFPLITSDFQFVDSSLVYLVTSTKSGASSITDPIPTGYLYKSVDAGNNWTQVTQNQIYSKNLYFLNDKVGLVTSLGIIQKTTDGGHTWQKLVYPLKKNK